MRVNCGVVDGIRHISFIAFSKPRFKETTRWLFFFLEAYGPFGHGQPEYVEVLCIPLLASASKLPGQNILDECYEDVLAELVASAGCPSNSATDSLSLVQRAVSNTLTVLKNKN